MTNQQEASPRKGVRQIRFSGSAAKVAMPGPSFDRTDGEDRLARKAATRARALEVKYGGEARSQMEWVMDFVATHANGNPLDFDKLLAFDDFSFAHDAFGICRHLDRETGELTGFFLPRCSRPEAA